MGWEWGGGGCYLLHPLHPERATPLAAYPAHRLSGSLQHWRIDFWMGILPLPLSLYLSVFTALVSGSASSLYNTHFS